MEKWSFRMNDGYGWVNCVYETKEEAEKAAKEYAKCNGMTQMEIGRGEAFTLPVDISAEDILENLEAQYEQDTPDYDGELYEDIDSEHLMWLKKNIRKVIRKFYERVGIRSNYYGIEQNISSMWKRKQVVRRWLVMRKSNKSYAVK